jgi:TPR repeat protein
MADRLVFTAEPRVRRGSSAFMGLLAAVMLVLPGWAFAVSECDRLAGHRLDPDGVVFGVSRSAMDLKAAEKACREAVETYPTHARSNYQMGRVLYYSGRGKESLPYLQAAADAGYPQALFVLGFIQTIEDQVPIDFCAAADLWLRAAALDHPFTGVYLTTEYLKGNLDACEVSISDAELKRLAHIAVTQIAYADSEGRIEEMQALLDAHLASAKASATAE